MYMLNPTCTLTFVDGTIGLEKVRFQENIKEIAVCIHIRVCVWSREKRVRG